MQLVYFNDLHKNLGCNKDRTAKISIIPVTFTIPPVKFYALPFSSASFFSHALCPPASNCPIQTDISIAQKTCELRPVDISVPATKCSKLIYQSVYSLLETLAGNPFRLLTAFAATFPKGSVLALSVTCGDSSPKGRAKSTAGNFLIAPNTLASRLTACLPPWGSWRGSA